MRFLTAVGDGVHFEGNAPTQGTTAHNGSGANILYLSPPTQSIRTEFLGTVCPRGLEPDGRTVTRFFTKQLEFPTCAGN